MRFVGVDLAWGRRATTGLCVIEAGRVLDSGLRREFDDVCAWLFPHVQGPCVVAVDAPLIVRNRTGRRPCEADIGRCFGRHGAGPHPSNTSLPAFRDGVRAAALAERLGLSIDPRFAPGASVRRIMEVFLHPALVALFGLKRPPPYKAKPGRNLASRRAALEEVATQLEGLRDFEPPLEIEASPRWRHLRARVASTVVAADLGRAEDEIDAHVCAYIALHYWTHGTARARVVGDLDTGYIVTPTSAEQAACLDRARDVVRRTRVRP
jgi:predicted RNase H-like nuclease